MKILLTNPPWITNNGYGVRAGSRWPFTLGLEKDGSRGYVPFPFFLTYAASFLKKHLKTNILVDAVAEGLSDILFMERVRGYSPDVAVLETSTPSFDKDILTAQRIKQNLRDVKLVLVGPHVSVFPFQILDEYGLIDYILVGEYEYTLLELINCLENGGGWENVLGLAYRENDEIKINNRRPAIKDLNSLPWPERESLPMYNYRDNFCNLPAPNVQVAASRGCPYQCVFCLWPQVMYNEYVYRKRNPKKVIDEIIWLVNKYDFRAVYFDDDTFNIDREYVLDICNEMKIREFKIPWAIMARADLMDEKLLKFLKDAGLYAVKYGVELADEKILDHCGKNMNLKKSLELIKFTKQVGIKVHLTFCLGLPGETKETIQKTIRFIEAVNPDSAQFSFATPFPGTRYFEYVKKKGWLLSEHWPDFDGNRQCIIRTEELSNKDLENILPELRNKFINYENRARQ